MRLVVCRDAHERQLIVQRGRLARRTSKKYTVLRLRSHVKEELGHHFFEVLIQHFCGAAVFGLGCSTVVGFPATRGNKRSG